MHCSHIGNKIGKIFGKLARVAGNRWGLRYGTLNTIYRGLSTPIAEYAAFAWADICTKADTRKLRAIQRQALLAITGAYGTASWESLYVVAGAIPIDLLLGQHRTLFNLRRGRDAKVGNAVIQVTGETRLDKPRVLREVYKVWQDRWNASSKGRTTYTYLNSISNRLEARWIRPSYYCTQALTGHGDFRSYLRERQIVNDGTCLCGRAEDTVAHFLLECPAYEPQRVALRDFVPDSEWKWPEAAKLLVSSPEAFRCLSDFCDHALYLKKHE